MHTLFNTAYIYTFVLASFSSFVHPLVLCQSLSLSLTRFFLYWTSSIYPGMFTHRLPAIADDMYIIIRVEQFHWGNRRTQSHSIRQKLRKKTLVSWILISFCFNIFYHPFMVTCVVNWTYTTLSIAHFVQSFTGQFNYIENTFEAVWHSNSNFFEAQRPQVTPNEMCKCVKVEVNVDCGGKVWKTKVSLLSHTHPHMYTLAFNKSNQVQ